MSHFRSVRGMPDVPPGESVRWRFVESAVREVLGRYGYREIRLPLLEFTELFARSVGEGTDIVEKEMYTFEDRGGASITLRPEGTAGCVRACEAQGLLFNQTQRLWYAGPMFRYERPQKGRYRQFEQIGAECFGFEGPDIDAELLLLQADCWRALGVDAHLTLELNTMGSPAARAAYREALIEYLTPYRDELDADSRRRLHQSPLRIFDSKVPRTREILAGAPAFFDWLDDASRAHFDRLRALLEAAGQPYVVNPHIVRGLDYYTRTVFEWTTDRLGAQGTVSAGGRYDGLVEQLGGRPTPAIGFALGLERVVLLAQACGRLPGALEQEVDAYLLVLDDALTAYGLTLARQLREAVPALRLQTHCGGGRAKARFRKADASGAAVALVIGEAEAAAGTVAVKPLRGEGEQQSFGWEALVAHLRELTSP